MHWTLPGKSGRLNKAVPIPPPLIFIIANAAKNHFVPIQNGANWS
jgi:hypothetical protein